MHAYNKEEAIRKITELASEKKPFIFLISYDTTECYVEEPGNISASEMLYNFDGVSNAPAAGRYPGSVNWLPEPVSYSTYKQSFDCVMQHIQSGNSFLTNLTFATPVKTNLTLKQIFTYSTAGYKVWMKDHFVCFSPEIFVRIIEDRICSYPMKGTINALLPDARTRLLNDPKEAAEHATITDLIRNDLSCVAEGVTVARYRYLDELLTNKGCLLQVSSEISARLPDGYTSRMGEILFSMLPAGSITGAPKCKTMKIIAEAETSPRGFYTGVMGYYDGKNLDSAVMIRFIEQTDDGFVFRSGGGITSRSTPESEYKEMIQKVYVPIY